MNAQPQFRAAIWSGAITGPGLYLGVPEDVYHSDPCPAPALSSSIGKVALVRSLAHAKAKHPRLSVVESDEDEAEEKYVAAREIGKAAHAFAFGVGAEVVEIEAKAFTTKAAREERDAAMARGAIPLKTKDFRRAKRMAEIARPVIADLLGGSKVAEAMLAWEEGGFWRRGLIDRMTPDARVIVDFKTTARSAAPPEAEALLYSCNYHFQEAFYRRGLDILDPLGAGRRRFFFVVQEQEPPFEICVPEVSEAGRSLADEQVEMACAIWDRAMATGEFPGYPRKPFSASPAPWLLSRWENRVMTDETLNGPEGQF
jgi:hypothetical protein